MENMLKMNPALNEALLERLLTALNAQMPWWLLLHSFITIYAAARWNKWIWVAIRVPGFYTVLFLTGQTAIASVLRG